MQRKLMADNSVVLERAKPISAVAVSKFGALKRIRAAKTQQQQQQKKLRTLDNDAGFCCEFRMERVCPVPSEWEQQGAPPSPVGGSPWGQGDAKPYPNAVKVLPPFPLRLSKDGSALEEERQL